MNIKIHSSSSQIVQKKNRKMIGTGNSKDKKLYVNKSGAMMLTKKNESIKNNESIFTNTFSNQNIFSNTKKNMSNICSSFRQNNRPVTSKLQGTISFGNNVLSNPNVTVANNIKKLQNKNECINNYCHNNVLTSTNINIL